MFINTILLMTSVVSAITHTTKIHSEDHEKNDSVALTDAYVNQLIEKPLNEQQKLETLRKPQKNFTASRNENNKESTILPPEYMILLYNISQNNIHRRKRGANTLDSAKFPYGSNSVRCIFENTEKNPSSKLFYFDIRGAQYNESMLGAELHLYPKLKPSSLLFDSNITSSIYNIKIYQVLPNKSLDEFNHHELLSTKSVRADSLDWLIFDVQPAMFSWLSGELPNLGLMVSATTTSNEQVQIDFIRGYNDFSNKQPFLIIFNNVESSTIDLHFGGNKVHNDTIGKRQNDCQQIVKPKSLKLAKASSVGDFTNKDDYVQESSLPRTKRSIPKSLRDVSNDPVDPNAMPCSKHSRYFDLTRYKNIIAPPGFYGNECSGPCLKLDNSTDPVIRYLNNIIRDAIKREKSPLCEAERLSSITVMYYDKNSDPDESNGVQIVLKPFKDVIESCRCRDLKKFYITVVPKYSIL